MSLFTFEASYITWAWEFTPRSIISVGGFFLKQNGGASRQAQLSQLFWPCGPIECATGSKIARRFSPDQSRSRPIEAPGRQAGSRTDRRWWQGDTRTHFSLHVRHGELTAWSLYTHTHRVAERCQTGHVPAAIRKQPASRTSDSGSWKIWPAGEESLSASQKARRQDRRVGLLEANGDG